MSPSAVEAPSTKPIVNNGDAAFSKSIVKNDAGENKFGNFTLPEVALQRMKKAGIDLSKGYPEYPPTLKTFNDVHNLQPEPIPFVDAGTRADPEKKALFGAAKEVRHLTFHCGTEILGLQLKDLTDTMKDELALLIAERGVVVFRDQDLSPQQQVEVTSHFGPIFVCVLPLFLAISLVFWLC